MTISASTKFRAIGGSSVLALAAGLTGVAPALAAPPPSPVIAVPTPATPAAPANPEECTLITTATPPEVICAPGTDADGFQQPYNSIELTVQNGSQVQGEIDLLDGVTVTVDGDIVTTSTNPAIDVGLSSTVINNGFIGGASQLVGLIDTEAGSSITNNGTIFTTVNSVAGIQPRSNSTVVNNGLIAMTGFNVFGVLGDNFIGFGSNVTVTNSVTGQIIIDGQGGNSAAINVDGPNNTVVNDGLLQTFGGNADGIRTGAQGSVTNNGNIQTAGNGAEGISTGNDSTVINTGAGRVFTFGDNLASVAVGTNSTVQNNGIILTQGDSAVGVVAGAGSTVVNNPTGQITTLGANSHGVVISGDGTLINARGLIQTGGLGAEAVIITGAATIDNAGTISSGNARAIDVAGVSTITNRAGGVISATNGDAIRFNTDGSTLTNDGSISAAGAGALGVNAQVANMTVTNNGTINTSGTNSAAIIVGATSNVTNTGTVSTTADNTVAVAAGADSTVTNSGTISTIGVSGNGVVFTSTGTLNNTGMISTLRADATAVTALGSANVNNSGMITATTGRGVDIAGGDIRNEAGASITGGTDAIRTGGSRVANRGTISGANGVVGSNTSQTVINYGTISGTTNAAALGDGGDIFASLDGSVENGIVDGGAGNDLYANLITDGTDRTFNLDAIGTQYLNFETLRFGTQSFDFFNNTSIGAASASGVMTLTGTLAPAPFGSVGIINTAILDGTINNQVSLFTGFPGGTTPVFTITGNGAINSATDGIVLTSDGWTIDNAGSITVSGAGSLGINAASWTATVNNTGTITSSGTNSAAVYVGGASTVTNSGTISTTANSGVGVAAGAGSTITNAAGGTISTTGMNSGGVVFIADGTLTNGGTISTQGTDATAVTAVGNASVTNTGSITATAARAVDILSGTVSNGAGASITGGTDAIRVSGIGVITNQGTISGDNGIVGGTGPQIVYNLGTLTGTTAAATLGDGDDVFVKLNGGTETGTVDGGADNDSLAFIITDTTDRTFNLDLLGTQYTNFEDFRFGSQTFDFVNLSLNAPVATGIITLTGTATGNGTIINTGILDGTVNGTVTLQQGANFGIAPIFWVTGNGVIAATGDGVATFQTGWAINNAGSITSTAGNGVALGAGGSTVTNNGTISGVNGVQGSTGADTVVNFGSLTGTTSGASLGLGMDMFQQWTGATVTGGIDLGGDNDTFILEGALSSVTGNVDGGAGNDTAILAGDFDSDNIIGFETVQLGSTLGGTLNDLTVSGNRKIVGDIVVTGTVNFDLGVDSIVTTNGDLTLAAGSVINIGTPLDQALVGQTVKIITDTGVFTNNGVTINIDDDDLLLDYTPVLGSVLVQVTAVNPLNGNPDPNLANFGAALAAGLGSGTLNAANFTALNGLTAAQFSTAAQDALPSLSESLGREIFETASFASDALEHHLAGEGSRIWGQFGIRGAEQDALSPSVDGYESDQLIFTIGADFIASEGIRVGLMASYADIDSQDLRGDTVPTETTDAESIKLGAYAGITLFDRGFLNSEFSYLTGNAETARNGFFGAITSDFDFDGFQGRSTLGYDLIADENVSITPTVGVNFARINFDDAQETGGFGFLVERGDATFAELRGGLEFGAQVSDKVAGFIKGTVIRDLIGSDDPRSFRLSSNQLTRFFAALPQREQNRFELEAGGTINVSDTFSIDLGYLGDFNEGYKAHAARATVRIGF